MWFFPTRKRPALAQRLMDACSQTGMTSPGVLVVDGTSEDYRDVVLPQNVGFRVTGEHLEFAGVLRWIFQQYPHESFYGFICDDGLPRTQGWDKELEATAGDWHVSCANDLLHAPGRWTYGALGGELIRALGFFMPPGFIHLYTDNVWEYLDSWLKIMRYREDVVIEELHFSNGKAPFDATYERTYMGEAYGQKDRDTFEKWVASPDTRRTIERVLHEMERANVIRN